MTIADKLVNKWNRDVIRESNIKYSRLRIYIESRPDMALLETFIRIELSKEHFVEFIYGRFYHLISFYNPDDKTVDEDADFINRVIHEFSKKYNKDVAVLFVNILLKNDCYLSGYMVDEFGNGTNITIQFPDYADKLVSLSVTSGYKM